MTTTDELEKVPDRAREVRLAKHLEGALSLDNFDPVEVDVTPPGPGEVLVRTDYLALSAAVPELMKPDCPIPMPLFAVGERLSGPVVGTVVRSNAPDLAVGDLVQSFAGWCEYSTGPAEGYFKLSPDVFPNPAYYLGNGPTAYYGMADVAQAGEGDVVFVSGAAGGVGSLAGQIARCRGAAKVIGSAGSPAKVAYLVDELGFDAAFDYHDGPVVDQLRRLAPDGITVFFDNVGGAQFEAAVQAAAPHARFALCGALAGQLGDPAGRFPKLDLMTAITKHLTLLPFACHHTPDQLGAWFAHFGQWLGEGRFVYPQTVVEVGLSQAPDALLALLRGEYRGNVAVHLTAG